MSDTLQFICSASEVVGQQRDIVLLVVNRRELGNTGTLHTKQSGMQGNDMKFICQEEVHS